MNRNLHLDGNGYKPVVSWGGKRNHSYLDNVRIPTIEVGFMRYTLGAYVSHKVYMSDTMTDKRIKVGFLD